MHIREYSHQVGVVAQIDLAETAGGAERLVGHVADVVLGEVELRQGLLADEGHRPDLLDMVVFVVKFSYRFR